MDLNNNEINASLRSIGGACNDYMAGPVSWNDGKRGCVINPVTKKPEVSPWGSNITDSRILAKDGKHLTYVRPKMLDEKLAIVNSTELIMQKKDGTQTTLQEVLENLPEYVEYRGYTNAQYNAKAGGEKVVVRVQNSWVPIEKGQTKRDIVPTHYSYQTFSADNPRNLLLVGTSQGIHVHSDGVGAHKLMGHSIGPNGEVQEHWFECEPTQHLVGSAQYNDDESSLSAKKARACEFGIKGMGPRSNLFMTVSLGLQQKAESTTDPDASGPVYRGLGVTRGISSAARVSVDYDNVHGVAKNANMDINFNVSDFPIVTFLLYNAIQVPEGQDCENMTIDPLDLACSVRDMEYIYNLAKKSGGIVCMLSELPAMLHRLEEADMAVIRNKLTKDPVVPHDPFKPTVNAMDMAMSKDNEV